MSDPFDSELAFEQRKLALSSLQNVREVRSCPAQFEMRDVANGTGGDTAVFSGYACVTSDDDSAAYSMSDPIGDWMESVSVHAFDKTVREADVSFLLNHSGMTLARCRAGEGTMRMSAVTAGSPTGLFVEARLDTKNPYVLSLRSAVERGDIDEMSFAFRVVRQEWNEDYDRRYINEVNMDKGDVSAVNYGANPHTGGLVAMRSKGALEPRALFATMKELRDGSPLSRSALMVLRQVAALDEASDVPDDLREMLAELSGTVVTDKPKPDEDEDDDGSDGDVETGERSAPAQAAPLRLPNRSAEARARLARLRAA